MPNNLFFSPEIFGAGVEVAHSGLETPLCCLPLISLGSKGSLQVRGLEDLMGGNKRPTQAFVKRLYALCYVRLCSYDGAVITCSSMKLKGVDKGVKGKQRVD